MVKNTHSCIPSKFLLEALLEHTDFSDFESKGEDDWRPPASKFKNSGFSISSKGWSLHADKGERREYNLNGTSGSLFDLAKARSLLGQAKVKSGISEQISAKKSVDTFFTQRIE